jgi:hypothetical protein
MNANHQQPRLPNLFIVGAPKCGTTAWAEYLGTHPDIFFPPHKDQCFFAHDLPNFRLTRTDTDYAELFAGSRDAKVIGEASAMYLFSEAAAAAIHDHDPASKILIFLRDQQDYLPALHNQFLREFAEEIEDFEKAWKLSGRRPASTIPATCLEPRTLDYVAMGSFKEQVERYLAVFPPEQLLVIRFQDWTAEPRTTYLTILGFLGLTDDGRTDFLPVNQGTTYRVRKLARLVIRPPGFVRRVARLIKKFPFGDRLYRAIRDVGLWSAPGYRAEVSSELRDQIKRRYAMDNRQLDELLGACPSRNRTARIASTLP